MKLLYKNEVITEVTDYGDMEDQIAGYVAIDAADPKKFKLDSADETEYLLELLEALVDEKIELAETAWTKGRKWSPRRIRQKKLRYERAQRGDFNASKNQKIIDDYIADQVAVNVYADMWESLEDQLSVLIETDIKQSKRNYVKVSKWGKNKTQADVDALFTA